jgi:hypothetical protein
MPHPRNNGSGHNLRWHRSGSTVDDATTKQPVTFADGSLNELTRFHQPKFFVLPPDMVGYQACLASDIGPVRQRVSQMKRLLSVASVAHMLFLSQFSDACAAGPYDGEWTGSATATDGRCKPAIITLTVLGRAVTGQARFVIDTPNINGTVREDGTFGATVGFQPLTGRFIQDEVEGTFRSGGCEWKMLLKRTK